MNTTVYTSHSIAALVAPTIREAWISLDKLYRSNVHFTCYTEEMCSSVSSRIWSPYRLPFPFPFRSHLILSAAARIYRCNPFGWTANSSAKSRDAHLPLSTGLWASTMTTLWGDLPCKIHGKNSESLPLLWRIAPFRWNHILAPCIPPDDSQWDDENIELKFNAKWIPPTTYAALSQQWCSATDS